MPYGQREEHGWVRQLDGGDLDDLLGTATWSSCQLSIFRDDGTGWRRCTPAEAADARYRGYSAEAVACVALSV